MMGNWQVYTRRTRRTALGRTCRLGALALMVVLGVGRPTWAQIEITVPEPGGAGLPIALSPLAPQSPGADQSLGVAFSDIIARDLDLSGLFRVIDRATYREGPDRVMEAEINFGHWSVLGALALMKGSVWLEGESLTVEARLFDVAQRRYLGGKRYRGRRADLRRMAHRFADHVMLLLTGEEGPFNSRIAFVSNRAGGRAKEVYVTDLTGAEVERMTHARSFILAPHWHPGATELLYISYKRGGPYPFRLELRSGKERQLSKTIGYGGQWSPDGKTIAVSGERDGNIDLFLLSPRGRVIRRLTTNPGIDVSPAWSPDGRQLAFCSSRSGGPQIYVLDLASEKIRRVTFSGAYNTSPTWSPKGGLIAYTSQSRGMRVKIVDVASGQERIVAAGEEPSWSPDGRYVVLSADSRLWVASQDGRSLKQLTGGGGDDTSPTWSARLQ